MLDVLLCIENRIYREGLQYLLKNRAEVGEVGICSALPQLCEMLARADFDVVLIDDSLEATPAGAVRTAARAARGRAVIALGLEDSDDDVLTYIEAGASAYVTKNASVDDLVAAIRAAAAGELPCAPRIARRMQERLANLAAERDRKLDLGKLSQRERHILRLLERSLSNKEIARELGVEVSTIKNHVHNIIVKLSVRTRSEAAAASRLAAE
jgi:DNA-binding NarL/FixJ family response regulator